MVIVEEQSMAQLKLTEDLRPLADLSTQASEVVQQVHSSGRPLVLTREGRGVPVLLSVEAFENLQSLARQREMQRAVDDAVESMPSRCSP